MPSKPRSRRVALAWCIGLGVFGAHRVYAGRPGTGLAQALTLGGLFIWSCADLLMILAGRFKDGDGNVLEDPPRR